MIQQTNTREIKFRAWDSEEERMVYSDAGEDDYIWQLDYDGLILLRHETDNEENHFYPKIEVPFMEFSGLKDKNNKDIYEGDILKGKFGTGIGMASTRYKEFYFSISHHLSKDISEFGIDIPKNYSNYRFYPYISQCEIIGNIFENPDLILKMTLIDLQK